MLRLKSSDPDFARAFARLVKDRRESDEGVARDVQTIIEDVRLRGDEALAEYTAKFDGHSPAEDAWRISPEDCREAFDALKPDLRAALELAAQRIRAYHAAQLPEDRDYTDETGMRLGARWTAVDGAGLYVPGGRASYPSSLLMNAIPAKVAGVERLVVVTPTPKGEANPLVLAAAHLAGADEVWRVGGAQAVAALAYGTQTIAPVDKIVGPGNAYVAAAKRQVFGKVGIDMVAGPSEVLILADGTANADWIAADLLAQAEHDTAAQSILVTDSAAGATAFSCGKKSYNGAISVLSDYEPCGSVLEAAKRAGYMTGLVVTTDITDATPACFASHVLLRQMQDDIALQEVGHGVLGRSVDLMLGGGRCHFLPNGTDGSCRADDVDVIKLAQDKYGWTYTDSRDGFDKLKGGDKA
ncbi:MAG: histidinol dehydrogenase, partial [Sphingomonadales bacterium 39-62-4]